MRLASRLEPWKKPLVDGGPDTRRSAGSRPKGVFPTFVLGLCLLLQSCDRSPGDASPTSPGRAAAQAGVAQGTQGKTIADEPHKAPLIPAGFQGEWNAERSACGSGLHDSGLVITARELRYYESGGPVTAAELISPGVLKVEASVQGEGESWTEQRVFQVSPDGQTLTDITNTERLVRRRYPDPR